MLFRELSSEAQNAIVDAMLGEGKPLPEGPLKDEVTSWANDDRNFFDDSKEDERNFYNEYKEDEDAV